MIKSQKQFCYAQFKQQVFFLSKKTWYFSLLSDEKKYTSVRRFTSQHINKAKHFL